MSGGLTGYRHVRVGRWALQEARKLFPNAKDRAILRRHALKLRFWPKSFSDHEAGLLEDLNWSWIKALREERIGELRIDDTIGGQDNLRVLFFDPHIPKEPLPELWVLAVFQKKRDDFSQSQLTVAKTRRNLILERFYGTT